MGFALCLFGSLPAVAQSYIETPYLTEGVNAGKLPPVAQRVPSAPLIVDMDGADRQPGLHGGTLRMLMGDQRDIRMMTIYGYARLVGYNAKLDLVPDLLEAVDIVEGRIFTLKLRAGHRWSDGHPFTAEDFRYYWEDVANNKRLSPGGPQTALVVNGEQAKFEVIDPQTVRYTWSKPNPVFLPSLAGGQPLYIYMPAHYLKSLHQKYASPEELQKRIKTLRVKDWGAAHERLSRQYRPENPELPTLDPWRNTTRLPAELFTFVRNPFYHRVDSNGRQLPYIDEVKLLIGTSSLIPAKTGAGEADLQARYLRFDNYTFLKDAEKRQDFDVRLWKRAEGAYVALMPNLNVMDPGWRSVMHDVRFRRALSLAINRKDINQVVFFGLAKESGNTALPDSPLFERSLATAWTGHDPAMARKLLDEAGLSKFDTDGVRLLPDGRRAEFTVESAGESTEETDILELIGHDLMQVGIKIYGRSTQRDVFRRRISAGQTLMSISTGMDNALVAADMEPEALAPTNGQQFQWPRFGQYTETGGREGETPDLPAVKELVELYGAWRSSVSNEQRREIWQRMLKINAEQVFTIGIVNGTSQPVVVSRRLRNVPMTGLWSFEPGAFFGIYKPDTFWFDNRTKAAQADTSRTDAALAGASASALPGGGLSASVK
jgi:peptide/nickel transport system substrate-binding protein